MFLLVLSPDFLAELPLRLPDAGGVLLLLLLLLTDELLFPWLLFFCTEDLLLWAVLLLTDELLLFWLLLFAYAYVLPPKGSGTSRQRS